MKRQNGQALILVLILMALGTLLIVPSLKYTFTGMRSVRVYEDALTRLYNSDSAIEAVLSELLNRLNQGPIFDLNNPQPVTYYFQLGADLVPVTISLPTVPPSENYGTGNIRNLMVEVKPNWAETLPGGGSSTFEYIMRIDTQTYNLGSFRYTLPKGLTHVPSSSYYKGPDGNAYLAWDAEVNLTTHQVKMKDGQWQGMSLSNYTVVYAWPPDPYSPTTSYLYITTGADGRQTLDFRPYFGSPTGRRILIQTSQVTGTPPWGVSYLKPAVFQGGFGTITIPETAAVGVAMYILSIPIGGVTYSFEVVAGYDYATGGFKIVSYKVVG